MVSKLNLRETCCFLWQPTRAWMYQRQPRFYPCHWTCFPSFGVELFTTEATRNILENLFNLLPPPNVAKKQRSAVWMIIRCVPLYLRTTVQFVAKYVLHLFFVIEYKCYAHQCLVRDCDPPCPFPPQGHRPHRTFAPPLHVAHRTSNMRQPGS